MRSKDAQLLKVTGLLAAGAGVLTYSAYRKDIEEARRRISTGRQFFESTCGPIEFAESGNGPAVLVSHGAGGGFDQALDLGRAFLGDGYRIIAPSRFGYLGTPVPQDPSAEAQADVHLQLLDALKLDAFAVIGVSAGAPSAMQLCLRHPERCSALALIVPGAYAPDRPGSRGPSAFFATVLDAISSSDALFWMASRVARPTLLRTILGTPVRDYRDAPESLRKGVDDMLRSLLPISSRFEGIRNDALVVSHLDRYPLESLRVPTLVISAADDLYDTYESGLYSAEHIPEGKFVGFRTGGHLLLGHEKAAREEVTNFFAEHRGAAAMAV